MGYYADIYVIKKTRSKKEAIEFLNFFLPKREESSNEYLIPQYSDNPKLEFDNANELMSYLELNPKTENSIYWRNKEDSNLNEHGMLFYTKDSHIIFGISIDTFNVNNRRNELECLDQMKRILKTEIGYITYECPPESTYAEFLIKTNKFESENRRTHNNV